jgi:hypothetical protein
MNEGLNSLIGLSWGFKEGQYDCAKLMVAAQKVLRGITIPYPYIYQADNFAEYAAIAKSELEKCSHRVKQPFSGVIGLFEFEEPFYHFCTFVSPTEFLHIPRNNTSRITRFTRPYQKRMVGFYWYDVKEVKRWQQ